MPELRYVDVDDLETRAAALGAIDGFVMLVRSRPGGRGHERDAAEHAAELLGVPDHLAFVLGELCRDAAAGERAWPNASELRSLPFHDLCYGLLLPLENLAPARTRRLFGFEPRSDRLDPAARRELLERFFARDDDGLSLQDKVAFAKNDPFRGRQVTTSLNVLIDVLGRAAFLGPRELRNRLASVMDVAELFAMSSPRHRSDPPLTAREVLRTLQLLPRASNERKREVLTSIVSRAGRIENFFLARFLRRRGALGPDPGDDVILDALAAATQSDRARLDVARSLVSTFELARVIEEEGPSGLNRIALKPLSAVSPMLAGGDGDVDRAASLAFPILFEKKYDGVRLMIHKQTSAEGRVRIAAFTRRKLDWTELVPGLDALGRALPCRDAILDGELHAVVASPAGPRPSTVYDILRFVRGERTEAPLRLRFAAFDVIWLDGQDLTSRPLRERRELVQRLAAPFAFFPVPLPLELSDGELVRASEDLRRLYELFRAQGYEGGVAKDLASTYELGKRSSAWTKMKPAITLDLAITGALYATSSQHRDATFGTYLVSALAAGPSLAEVGSVQGLGALESQEVVRAILDDGLLTGRTLERETSTGRKAGVELRAGLVATVRFEGVVKAENGRLALRDAKILRVRMTEGDLGEVDRVSAIEDLWVKQGFR